MTTPNVQSQTNGAVVTTTETISNDQTQGSVNIPAKFMSGGKLNTQALIQSYLELEAKQGGQTQASQPSATNKSGTQVEHATNPEAAAVDTNAQNAVTETSTSGFSKFETEYAQNGGKLSDTSYAELAKQGFDKKTVDDFISFRTSQNSSHESSLYTAAGNKESYEAMVKWAGANLKPDEITAFNNTVVDTRNPAAAKFAVEALKNRFERAVGRQPTLLGGEVTSNDGSYGSFDELQAATRDPRYRRDKAYRAQVERKLANSKF